MTSRSISLCLHSLALALTEVAVARNARHLLDLSERTTHLDFEAGKGPLDPVLRPRAAVLVLSGCQPKAVGPLMLRGCAGGRSTYPPVVGLLERSQRLVLDVGDDVVGHLVKVLLLTRQISIQQQCVRPRYALPDDGVFPEFSVPVPSESPELKKTSRIDSQQCMEGDGRVGKAYDQKETQMYG